MIVNVWSEPQFTGTAPLGEIWPWAPAEAEIVLMSPANEALIVWFAVTFVKPYLVTAPTELPSTRTSSTW